MRIVGRHFIVAALLMSGLLLISAHAFATPENRLYLGTFSGGGVDGWQVKAFDGNTDYKIVFDDSNAQHVLMASSHNSASGLFKEQRIDLQKTPYLHWSWKTGKLYKNLNEKTKQGDDYVARLYIVIDGGLFFWKTYALNYVWSSSFDKDAHWQNPYTANAMMFAVESGEKNLGRWNHYQRNVADDLKALFGKKVRYIDAIAIMTDSDNAGQQAITYYGDIYLSAQP